MAMSAVYFDNRTKGFCGSFRLNLLLLTLIEPDLSVVKLRMVTRLDPMTLTQHMTSPGKVLKGQSLIRMQGRIAKSFPR